MEYDKLYKESQIAKHYDKYPYPFIHDVSITLPNCFKRNSINFLLNRREKDQLLPDMSLWIAGCGTIQAIQWALEFPNAKILATDVSKSALSISIDLAKKLNIKNVDFQLQDIEKSNFDEEFDFVVCTGVIHHTSNPKLSLKVIKSALKKNGAALLMVYSRVHREPLQRIKRVVELFQKGKGFVNSQYDFTVDILNAIADSQDLDTDLKPIIKILLDKSNKEPAAFADAMINPVENFYDIDELFDLLESVGLNHVSWYEESRWNIWNYITDDKAINYFCSCESRIKYKIIYELAGINAPTLSFLVESDSNPKKVDFSREEILSMLLVLNDKVKIIRLEPGKAFKNIESEMSIVYGNYHEVKKIDEEKINLKLSTNELRLLSECNGSLTTREIIEKSNLKLSFDEKFKLIRELFPDRLGVVAPAN